VILSLPLYFLVLTCYLLPFAVVDGAIEAETDFPNVIVGFTIFEVLTILDVTTAPITY
jgi:predicted membrane chloride channel (bestrophin family)